MTSPSFGYRWRKASGARPTSTVERLLIEETLRTTGGNKQRAAELLGIAATDHLP